MQRRAFLVTLIGAAGLALPAVAAFSDDVVAQLTQQGYRDIAVSNTWLGRVRILATRDGGTREIVLNPRTGEILRDLWTASDGAQRAVSIVDDVSKDGNSAASGDGSPDDSSGNGSSGSDDGSSSGSSGSDSGSDDGGDSGGSDGGSSSGSGISSGSSDDGVSLGGSSDGGSDDGGSSGGSGSGSDSSHDGRDDDVRDEDTKR